MLDPGDRAYLKGRGYSDGLLTLEDIRSVGETLEVEDLTIRGMQGTIAWIVRSMSGALIGVQTRKTTEKEYRWFQRQGAEHLPILYGSIQDYQVLWDTGSMLLTEGVFDRVAVKRCLPDRAVFARLSKGAANQLGVFAKRYVKKMWLAFDMDGPGRDAIVKAEAKLGGHMEVQDLRLPAKDPSAFYAKNPGGMRTMLKQQIDLMEF